MQRDLTLGRLLVRYSLIEDSASVLTFYRDATAIRERREYSHPNIAALVCCHMGIALHRTNDHRIAAYFLSDADRLYRLSEKRNSLVHSNACFFLGSCLNSIGDYDGACRSFQRCGVMRRMIARDSEYTNALTMQALIHTNNMEFEKSRVLLQECYDIAFRGDDDECKISACRNMATVLEKYPKYNECINMCEYVIRFYADNAIPADRLYVYDLKMMGNSYEGLLDFRRALEYYQKCYDTARLLNMEEEVAQASMQIGACLVKKCIYEQSAPCVPEARESVMRAMEWPDPALTCNATLYLAYIEYLDGRELQAIDLVKSYIDAFIQLAPDQCASCFRPRSKCDFKLLKCSQCRTARCVLHASLLVCPVPTCTRAESPLNSTQVLQ